MKEAKNKAMEVLEYIRRRVQEGYPPSVREICRDLQIRSTSTAHKYLLELQEKGLIQKGDKMNRAIRLVQERPSGIPLLGTVTAGQPILAMEDVEDYLTLRVPGYQESELFALHVRGESMIKAGILDGDLIIVARTPAAENGEIVVALIDDSATVKRFYKEDGHFRLQPENDTMQPIYTDSVAILGKVVALVRHF